MNEIVQDDLVEKITLLLLAGESPHEIQARISCELSLIYRIMGDNVFQERVQEYLEKDLIISGLVAVKNIKHIASEENVSRATKLKANQWLAEKALEINRIGVDSNSPSTMTQDQLARRLKELQNEAIKRAKPIETGVLDNMLD